MGKSDRAILVTGATGKQGHAAARHLLKDGWHVRALVRDPTNEAAIALQTAGAQLVPGNLDDQGSVDRAVQGVYGVFSVQRTQSSDAADGFTTSDEVRQGIAVADAAKAAGVNHLIYSSVGGADRKSGIALWESKWEIEKYLNGIGLPVSVIRPVSFMENLLNTARGLAGNALVSFPDPDRPVQFVAVDDIGAFAALMFRERSEYLGQAYEFAGDELTYTEVATAISRVVGRSISYAQLPVDVIERSPIAAAGVAFSRRDGWHANIPDLRRRLPTLKPLTEWLAGEGGRVLKALIGAGA
ncbi:NmrA/HSCARG family protein [Rhizobium sp. AB2/73]|uniref:NmrA/HSCARG family protein n=1 Tax=Rhizobium sp. AB2/73 TaxID=2795216 RepID=UPI001C5F40EC|nr:NmrA/HSCARG family protein [Rhizobium sp. AB2/73]QYA13190.1 NmrA/HSCARG family protein [Rhizobium sp. AB2/73]UEQ80877.1 NmrA/HSCARG family protein [Rhizobium sp. AB2/73]